MKVADYYKYAKDLTFFGFLALFLVHPMVTQEALSSPSSPSSSSSSETKSAARLETPTNPGFAPAQAQDQFQNRIMMRVNAPTRVSASSEADYSTAGGGSVSDWFQAPSLYAESLFTTSNDRRRFGPRAFQYTVQAGIDFQTKGDVIVGLMYSPSLYDGRVDDAPGGGNGITDVQREGHFGTLYLARAINEYFFAGATLTGGFTDTETEVQQSPLVAPAAITRTELDSFTIAPSVFLGASVDFDDFAVSSTVSYLYSESYFEADNNGGPAAQPTPSGFAQSTGTFTWLVQGTYFITDTIDVSASHKLTQIVHTNAFTPLGANNGEYDHNWSTVGLDINWLATQNLGIYGGVEYDLFQRNFKETITGNVGLSYNF